MKNTFFSRSGLFLGTFVSALLLIFGVGTMASLVAPVVISKFFDRYEYQAQLPLAQARDEEFLDLNSIPAKQLFPALTSPTDVAAGDWIRIPAIDVAVPLAAAPSLSDADVIKTLDLGAALYPNGILPGRLGNTFIAAHSTGNPWQGKFRFAFVRINEVAEGNEIHLDYQGTRYTYRVTHSRIVKPDPNFVVISDRPVPTITLMACWPLWSTSQRMLLHGELTNITQLTPGPV